MAPMAFINIGADLKGVSGLYRITGLQDYALLNLLVTWEICRYVSVFIRLENITDARYTINRGCEMPGFHRNGRLQSHYSESAIRKDIQLL